MLYDDDDNSDDINNNHNDNTSVNNTDDDHDDNDIDGKFVFIVLNSFVKNNSVVGVIVVLWGCWITINISR